MQIDLPKRNVEFDDRKQDRQHLHFYNDPPMDIIQFQDVEDIAVERLKVLRIVEAVRLKHNNMVNRQECKTDLMNKFRAENLTAYFKIQDKLTEGYRDTTSHFILRLAFCKTDTLRSWFLEQETFLFRFRFIALSQPEKEKFIQTHDLPFVAISDDEKKKWADALLEQYPYIGDSYMKFTTVFKLHFSEVEQQLRKRQVVLSRGFVYLPLQEMELLVTNYYRSQLSKALAQTRKSLSGAEIDDRMTQVLDSLPTRYTGKGYTSFEVTESDAITADMVEPLSQKNFPPCMRSLFDTLHQTNHLRHQGRMQFGLFLKGIGMKLDESIALWKKEFCKKITEDEFIKRYLYNIRHNYGQEGNRTNYTPKSCMNIIVGNPPGPGDAHGCPFRHWGQPSLKAFLNRSGVSFQSSQKILDLVNGQHYNIACNSFFEDRHGVASERPISHPNQYFEESMKISKGKATLPTAAVGR